MVIDSSLFITDLINRTISNYQFVKEMKSNDVSESKKLYEVTQLINSMYGLLVVPEEVFGVKYYDDPKDYIKKKKTEFSSNDQKLKKYHDSYTALRNKIDELRNNEGKPCIKFIISNNQNDYYIKENPVTAFAYYMRNALCHEGVGFYPIQNDFKGKLNTEITHICFIAGSNKPYFVANLSIDDLEELLFMMANLYREVEKGKSESGKKKYKNLYERIATKVQEELKK